MSLGIPGVGFRTEKRRFYPGGSTASHIVGLTNIDNQGIASLEKYIDSQGLTDLQASGLAVASVSINSPSVTCVSLIVTLRG